jgi:hypothetical protein
MGKKKKEGFQEFRKNDKSAYKTLKIPLTPFFISNADFYNYYIYI